MTHVIGSKVTSVVLKTLYSRLDNDNGDSFCKHKVLKDLAYVSIEISKAKIMRVVRRRRVSFTDILGNMGNEIDRF